MNTILNLSSERRTIFGRIALFPLVASSICLSTKAALHTSQSPGLTEGCSSGINVEKVESIIHIREDDMDISDPMSPGVNFEGDISDRDFVKIEDIDLSNRQKRKRKRRKANPFFSHSSHSEYNPVPGSITITEKVNHMRYRMEISKLKKELAKSQVKEAYLANENRGKDQEIADLKEANKSLHNQIEDIKKTCQVLMQGFKEMRRETISIQEENGKLKENFKRIEEESQGFKDRNQELEKKFETMQTSFEEVKRKDEKLKEKVNTLEEEKQTQEARLDALEQQFQSLETNQTESLETDQNANSQRNCVASLTTVGGIVGATVASSKGAKIGAMGGGVVGAVVGGIVGYGFYRFTKSNKT